MTVTEALGSLNRNVILVKDQTQWHIWSTQQFQHCFELSDSLLKCMPRKLKNTSFPVGLLHSISILESAPEDPAKTFTSKSWLSVPHILSWYLVFPSLSSQLLIICAYRWQQWTYDIISSFPVPGACFYSTIKRLNLSVWVLNKESHRVDHKWDYFSLEIFSLLYLCWVSK